MKKKRAAQVAATTTVDIETSPEVKTTVTSAAPDPENPFTDFTPETEPLTDDERDEEKARLADFFERKMADPTATWHAAPKPSASSAEEGFQAFMAELRGVTPA